MGIDVIVGVDPGLSGAICFMLSDGTYESVHDIPIMAKGKGKSRVKNQINAPALAKLIQNELMNMDGIRMAKVYLERVSSMPGQGVASVFSLGDTAGALRGIIGALGIPMELVAPQVWKKYYRLGKDKEISRAKAIELYPQAPLELKRFHNRAEAILIARYGCHSESIL